jgi:hypothetical protein
MDAYSWELREKRYKKKFVAGRKYIPGLFTGLDIPDEIEQVAVLVFAAKANHATIGGGRLVLIDELLEEIFRDFKYRHLANNAIPEHLLVLRSFQFVAEYKKSVFRALEYSG